MIWHRGKRGYIIGPLSPLDDHLVCFPFDALEAQTSSSASPLPSNAFVHTILMGRSTNKSVSRVYCDVNARLGPSWHEYGLVLHIAFPISSDTALQTIYKFSGDPKIIMRLFAKLVGENTPRFVWSPITRSRDPTIRTRCLRV